MEVFVEQAQMKDNGGFLNLEFESSTSWIKLNLPSHPIILSGPPLTSQRQRGGYVTKHVCRTLTHILKKKTRRELQSLTIKM